MRNITGSVSEKTSKVNINKNNSGKKKLLHRYQPPLLSIFNALISNMKLFFFPECSYFFVIEVF